MNYFCLSLVIPLLVHLVSGQQLNCSDDYDEFYLDVGNIRSLVISFYWAIYDDSCEILMEDHKFNSSLCIDHVTAVNTVLTIEIGSYDATGLSSDNGYRLLYNGVQIYEGDGKYRRGESFTVNVTDPENIVVTDFSSCGTFADPICDEGYGIVFFDYGIPYDEGDVVWYVYGDNCTDVLASGDYMNIKACVPNNRTLIFSQQTYSQDPLGFLTGGLSVWFNDHLLYIAGGIVSFAYDVSGDVPVSVDMQVNDANCVNPLQAIPDRIPMCLENELRIYIDYPIDISGFPSEFFMLVMGESCNIYYTGVAYWYDFFCVPSNEKITFELLDTYGDGIELFGDYYLHLRLDGPDGEIIYSTRGWYHFGESFAIDFSQEVLELSTPLCSYYIPTEYCDVDEHLWQFKFVATPGLEEVSWDLLDEECNEVASGNLPVFATYYLELLDAYDACAGPLDGIFTLRFFDIAENGPFSDLNDFPYLYMGYTILIDYNVALEEYRPEWLSTISYSFILQGDDRSNISDITIPGVDRCTEVFACEADEIKITWTFSESWFPDEIEWFIYDNENECKIIASGTYKNNQGCIAAGSIFTLEIIDLFGDGASFTEGGSYEVTDDSMNVLMSGDGNYGLGESVNVGSSYVTCGNFKTFTESPTTDSSESPTTDSITNDPLSSDPSIGLCGADFSEVNIALFGSNTFETAGITVRDADCETISADEVFTSSDKSTTYCLADGTYSFDFGSLSSSDVTITIEVELLLGDSLQGITIEIEDKSITIDEEIYSCPFPVDVVQNSVSSLLASSMHIAVISTIIVAHCFRHILST